MALHVETTGGRTERERLIWIGLTRLSGGRAEDTYETLVDPERRVPQHSRRRLGIEPEDLDGAPPARDVLPIVRELIGARAVAGHGVRAQVSQLNYELLWHGLPPVDALLIDTQDLAAARLPDLQRPTLAGVARRLGLKPPLRPLAGVSNSIAETLIAMNTLATTEQPTPLLDGAAAGSAGALARTGGGAGEAPGWTSPTGSTPGPFPVAHLRALPPGAATLPETPGVYIFRDGGGAALYVGKAANLRSRVAQHFTGAARAVRLDDGLLARVTRVDHEPVETELDALLREAVLIEQLAPPYNTQRAAHRTRAYVVLEGGLFPRPAASSGPAAGALDAEWFGPYRHTRAARETVRVLTDVFMLRPCRRTLPATRARMKTPCLRLGRGLCPAPCAGALNPGHYGVLVTHARGYLRSGLQKSLDVIDMRLAELAHGSEACGPDSAWEHATLREVRSRLLRVRRDHRPLAEATTGGRLLMIYPGASGGAVHYFVENGLLVARQQAPDAEPRACGAWDFGDGVAPEWPAAMPTPGSSESQHHVLLRWIQQHYGDPELLAIP